MPNRKEALLYSGYMFMRRHGLPVPGHKKVPRSYCKTYNQQLKQIRKDPRRFVVYENFFYDVGEHPANYMDYECAFAANILSKIRPHKILDIGSFRLFILGLLAFHKVTTIDLRERKRINDNETVITCDAKKLDLSDKEFDVVTSLCALSHFGLGRYGDEFDLDADKKAFLEMVRVLKPNGYLIFSATINRLKPAIAFNAHRLYSSDMLREYCLSAGLVCVEERFYSQKLNDFCTYEQITDEPNTWDLYLGCWKKKEPS